MYYVALGVRFYPTISIATIVANTNKLHTDYVLIYNEYMTAITYESIKRLEEAGFNHQQVAVLSELLEHRGISQQDLDNHITLSETRIESAIKDLKMDLREEISGLKTEIKLIKILAMYTATIISIIGTIIGIVKYLLH